VKALAKILEGALERRITQFTSLLSVKSTGERPLFILFFSERVPLTGIAPVIAPAFEKATGMPTEVVVSEGESATQLAE
jgi:hypothetical protein